MNKQLIDKKEQLIWVDIVTPKYALFFSKLVPLLKSRGYETIVTIRFSDGYDEAKEVLNFSGIAYHVVGGYGGKNIKDKFNARIQRQSDFLNIFETNDFPTLFMAGGSVEGTQTAFGLGIPIILFADTPIKGYEFKYEDMTIVSKLILPLASLIFHPFVVPSDVYVKFGVSPKNVIPHNFIDICLWMDDIVKKDENDFRVKYNLDRSKQTILIREEEYKAHYVKEQLPIIYNLIPMIKENFDVNIVIMPRYEVKYLKENFGSVATILEDKLKPEQFYPFIDMLVGGGGTMNLEASYYGIPVISTRSLWLYHDKYLIDNKLMVHVKTEEEALKNIEHYLGTKKDNKKFFCKDSCSFKGIIDKIEDYFKGIKK